MSFINEIANACSPADNFNLFTFNRDDLKLENSQSQRQSMTIVQRKLAKVSLIRESINTLGNSHMTKTLHDIKTKWKEVRGKRNEKSEIEFTSPKNE